MNIDESYAELGLEPGCSDAEVKEAWRRLAARWHPDRNASPQALRKIQRINRALAEIRRFKAEEETADEDEAAVEHALTVTLEEASRGCSRELHGELVEDCAHCAGSGVQAQPQRCADCAGSGRVRSQLWFSWMQSSMQCGACQGQGSTRAHCSHCEGRGRARARKYRCRVHVPAGSRAGHLLDASARVHGRSEPLALRVRIALQPHPFFKLDADGTVRCELPVDGFAWMAERWIEVPTPHGPQQMRLRRGYLTYRIKDGGLGGDCMVTVVPLFPETLGKAQEALVDRLVASNTGASATPAGERMREWQQLMAGWQAAQRP